MSEPYVIVDISDTLKSLNSRGEEIDLAVMESWYARIYSKHHCLQAIGCRDFKGKELGLMSERLRLTILAKRLGIDPAADLPPPCRIWQQEGVWFLIKDRSMLMGTGRGIEKCWRQLYP
jgi:hypothetical protein